MALQNSPWPKRLRRLAVPLSVVLFTLFLGRQSFAQPMRDQELNDYLQEYLKIQSGFEGNSIKAGMFLGYVRGALDALDGAALCLPDTLPMESVVQQVGKYVRAHPHSQRDEARALVLNALRDQFACRR